ncbi:MAG TPA: formylglycine-generating enzyme family protein [Phycisphaerales bacterium]|nr:formylglycine-generating enzyme family protein [Phycisphaerales bacterium]
MLYKMDGNGNNIRQLCFEQDHNFHPTVTSDGRILYLRWEYTDIPHVWARYLFTMNPDGTGQRQYYGSGNYWPNSIFYARPIPNHPTKIAGIVTGHHVGRVGELIIFDPAKGRTSVDGVVQQIPGRGKKVAALIEDKLTMASWPKFLHPFPLSEKYFLVSAKPAKSDLWGIYLVDVFDNITLIKEVEGYCLLEPIPIRKVKTPPVLASRVDMSRKDATVYIENIYKGPGLANVPLESVKELRLFTYHYAYNKFAGIDFRVGIDGPWEPKCVLGTVPVEDDGPVMFNVPANTPISIQPLDADGKALQLMRSWMTAMPGEFVSCTGCHEKQNQAPPSRMTKAQRKSPAEIKPFTDKVRGFSFKHDVQPVLDKYCVSCHDGSKDDRGKDMPNFKADQGKLIALKRGNPTIREIEGVSKAELMKKHAGVFQPSYIELRKYVRVGGFESDIRLLNPAEFHTNTSELFQILKKGHYGVQLDDEAMKMLVTWVDLNTPCHGTWQDTCTMDGTMQNIGRRVTYRKMYAGLSNDPESYFGMDAATVEPVKVELFVRDKVIELECAGWPLDAEEAARRQLQTSGENVTRQIDLGNGSKLDMVLIPAGKFVMGDADGQRDEVPLSVVSIDKPFWMAKFEITNAQFAQFDAGHESRYEHKGSWQFSEGHLGWPLDNPDQPVVRISFDEAMKFCKWLSKKTGTGVTLPTEAQWEYACRAGTATPLSYGDTDTDFSAFANMSDVTMRQLAHDTDGCHTGDITPREARFNDEMLVTANVGTYKPNRWGLSDMHGNVWEWTRSSYTSYPYNDKDGRNDLADISAEKVVRGGSWRDRPKRCRSGYRLSYPQWQKVYNVGLRVVIGTEETLQVAVGEKQ